MAREPVPTWFFSLVLVKLGRRVLLVQERSGEWYLPAGRLEVGETFGQAAIRETLEEAGIDVVLEGILRVEHSPNPVGSRVRVIFLARPADDTAPKAQPDGHSLQAAWFSVDELDQLPLRGEEVSGLVRDLFLGVPVFPLTLLQREGRPLRSP